MAELDPQIVPTEETPEKPVVVEEIPLVIPPNRPRKVYAGMWGPIEIGVVVAGVLALMMSFVLYFFWVRPSNNQLAQNKADAEKLESDLNSAKGRYGDIQSTETQVSKLSESVDDFETRYLTVQSNGQSALYQRLNGLIKAYGLENTSGPDYVPLETAANDKTQQTDEEKGRAKYKSLYPGVYVTTTVEGTYQNLRRFIREIETGREFVIISSIELAPSDTETKKEIETVNPTQAGLKPGAGAPSVGKGAAPPLAIQPEQSRDAKGKMHGETVALHLEMAAYFRRPNFAPASAPTEQ